MMGEHTRPDCVRFLRTLRYACCHTICLKLFLREFLLRGLAWSSCLKFLPEVLSYLGISFQALAWYRCAIEQEPTRTAQLHSTLATISGGSLGLLVEREESRVLDYRYQADLGESGESNSRLAFEYADCSTYCVFWAISLSGVWS